MYFFDIFFYLKVFFMCYIYINFDKFSCINVINELNLRVNLINNFIFNIMVFKLI